MVTYSRRILYHTHMREKNMDIREDLRRSVINSLPELNEIQDESLRRKVVDAWAGVRFNRLTKYGRPATRTHPRSSRGPKPITSEESPCSLSPSLTAWPNSFPNCPSNEICLWRVPSATTWGSRMSLILRTRNVGEVNRTFQVSRPSDTPSSARMCASPSVCPRK